MGVAGLMTGCPGPTDSTPPTTCDCTGDLKDLAFGETCGCGADICDCKVKEYGKINGIPVYRENGVTDNQAATGYLTLLDAYNYLIDNEIDVSRITADKLDGFILTVDGWPNFDSDKSAGKRYAKVKWDSNLSWMTSELQRVNNVYISTKLYNHAKDIIRMAFVNQGECKGAWHQICLV